MIYKPCTVIGYSSVFLPLRFVFRPYSPFFELGVNPDEIRAAFYTEDPSSLIYLAQRKRARVSPSTRSDQETIPNIFLAVTGLSDQLALLIFKEFVSHQDFGFTFKDLTERDLAMIAVLTYDFNLLRQDRGEHTREILQEVVRIEEYV